MRLFLLSLFLIVFSAPAMAQDLLREHRDQDPTARLLEGEVKKPETMEDYSTLYYERCVAGNTDKSLREYVETQCGCTTAAMGDFMTLKDLKNLFEKGKEGNFQQSRVMMLAYLPCLYTSINDFVFDGCYYSDDTRKQVRNAKKVCECYGRNMGNYIASKGEYIVPGFMRGGYNAAKGVPDPFAYIVSEDGNFKNRSSYEFEQCVMNKEYGWNK